MTTIATEDSNKMSLSDCGSLAFTDDDVREALRKRQPNDKSINDTNFGTITE